MGKDAFSLRKGQKLSLEAGLMESVKPWIHYTEMFLQKTLDKTPTSGPLRDGTGRTRKERQIG